MTFRLIARLLAPWLVSLPLTAAAASAQTNPGTAATPAQAEVPRDAFGRDTPRGALMAFLSAGRKGEVLLARHYLDTRLPEAQAEELANQLFAVLDARLPPRLAQVSGAPEGSRANPLYPDEEVVGTIKGMGGEVAVVMHRVTRRDERIWLFSPKTLSVVPALYDEVILERDRLTLPGFLVDQRLLGIRLSTLLAVFVGLPLLCVAIALLDRALTPVAARAWRRLFRSAALPFRSILPTPARLLLLALASQWLSTTLPMSLQARQSVANFAALVEIGAIAWLLLRLFGVIEQQIVARVPRANSPGALSLLRGSRRIADVIVVIGAVLTTLGYYGVDLTPVLAGLGVGGIAVALAAQKTLENIIAGASLIVDEAVRVGDYLKFADVEGTVEHIGLRSTRIRTLSRTVVSVPNGQIANAAVETMSARDKFWFHHMVGLRYETTATQLQAVMSGVRDLLAAEPSVERDSIRVRFRTLGAFSLDVEVFAYLLANDWNHFLELQERLLFKVTGAVGQAGASIAFPSHTMYVEGDRPPGGR